MFGKERCLFEHDNGPMLENKFIKECFFGLLYLLD